MHTNTSAAILSISELLFTYHFDFAGFLQPLISDDRERVMCGDACGGFAFPQTRNDQSQTHIPIYDRDYLVLNWCREGDLNTRPTDYEVVSREPHSSDFNVGVAVLPAPDSRGSPRTAPTGSLWGSPHLRSADFFTQIFLSCVL